MLDVAKLLNAEQQLDSLLPLVLSHASSMVDADRCTMFLVDRARTHLYSKFAQGTEAEIRVPLGVGIAGVVAVDGDIINIPDAYLDARFNRSFDDTSNYRTRSILAVPMYDASGAIAGVIQALNKKDGSAFSQDDEELLLALGGQAAVAIENAILHSEISDLFEGFVSAAVYAIESRDPSTAGHSERVAALTVSLAKSTEFVATGPYARLTFSPADLQEIRYASLLHDFGKVGVREHILTKAEKLFPDERRLIEARVDLARKDRQLQSMQRRLALVACGNRLDEVNREEDLRLHRELSELDEMLGFIHACNMPTVLPSGNFERLKELGQVQYTSSRGEMKRLLEPSEVEVLSILKGSLSPSERKEIENHVEHTFRFLSQIPWTRTLRRVPEIAYAHHEKLNGIGYPRHLDGPVIPVQSRMMAISDIYDALTASDRPYKKAMPHTVALDILHKEAQAGQLDSELLKVFIEAEVPKKAHKPQS